mmetsp:Transcript_34557/g.74947  ORF Transcript_34557/g.74947 Transcript_34557/m.74947 type:complete len:284 (-) Transcript_34557:127-978(-)
MKSSALLLLALLVSLLPLASAQLRQRAEARNLNKQHVITAKLGKHGGGQLVVAKGSTITVKNQRDSDDNNTDDDGGGSSNGTVLVRFDVQSLASSSNGSFVLEVQPDWALLGAKRFLDLVDGIGPDGEHPSPDVSGPSFWADLRFFRVIDDFMAQFGIAGNPEISQVWRSATIPDDPVIESNQRGYVSFATAGPNTRTTQMFINYKDNGRLDGLGFAPFAKVVKGMEVVDELYKEYGENPNQGYIQNVGNTYLEDQFPNLSYITSVKRIESLDEGSEKEDDLE